MVPAPLGPRARIGFVSILSSPGSTPKSAEIPLFLCVFAMSACSPNLGSLVNFAPVPGPDFPQSSVAPPPRRCLLPRPKSPPACGQSGLRRFPTAPRTQRGLACLGAARPAAAVRSRKTTLPKAKIRVARVGIQRPRPRVFRLEIRNLRIETRD